MNFIVSMFVLFVVSSFTITSTNAVEKLEGSNLQGSTVLDIGDLRRSSFPNDFIFGAGSSAYQVCIN
jgi:hypothetical protein